MPESIVEAPLLGVGQNRVRLRGFLELFFRRVIPRIAVRMMFHRELAVGAFDVAVAGGAGDAEDLVVIAFAHAFATFTIAGRSSRPLIKYPRRSSSMTSPSRWSGLV